MEDDNHVGEVSDDEEMKRADIDDEPALEGYER